MSFVKPAGMIAAIFLVLLCSTFCHAGEHGDPGQMTEDTKSGLAAGWLAIAAALAVGLCAVATGLAQSRIGAAGCGALAEKPKLTGTVLLLLAIPETMVILGFVVAVVILFT